eukprot:jgi/Ulvmu1/216/UM001_0220.1
MESAASHELEWDASASSTSTAAHIYIVHNSMPDAMLQFDAEKRPASGMNGTSMREAPHLIELTHWSTVSILRLNTEAYHGRSCACLPDSCSVIPAGRATGNAWLLSKF